MAGPQGPAFFANTQLKKLLKPCVILFTAGCRHRQSFAIYPVLKPTFIF